MYTVILQVCVYVDMAMNISLMICRLYDCNDAMHLELYCCIVSEWVMISNPVLAL